MSMLLCFICSSLFFICLSVEGLSSESIDCLCIVFFQRHWSLFSTYWRFTSQIIIYYYYLTLRFGYSVSSQINFDLRFTDHRLTWCSKLIVRQLCFIFPYIFDMKLRDPWFVHSLLTEPTLCRFDWLTVISICSVVLNYPACAASGYYKRRHSNYISDIGHIICCQNTFYRKWIREWLFILFLHKTLYTVLLMISSDWSMRDCRSDRPSEAMFLVRISNELQITLFNHQLIGQYSAINLMGDLMGD